MSVTSKHKQILSTTTNVQNTALQHCHQGNKKLYQKLHLVKSKPHCFVNDTEYSCMIHIPSKDISWLGKSSSSEEIMCYLLLSGYSSSMSTSRIQIKMKSTSRKELMNGIRNYELALGPQFS